MEQAIIVVKGSPYEQGVEQGKQLVDLIHHNTEVIRTKLRDAKCDNQRYWDFVERNVLFMKERHQNLYDEMRGIANGSGIPFKDILMINIPAYFLTEQLRQECTMLLARGKATLDGKTYVIKNRDMGMDVRQVVIHHIYDDGTSIVEVNGAGIVTYPASGMSSHGLGVTTTGFWSAKAPTAMDRVDAAQIFMNVHLILANCKTAKEALEYIKTTPCMNGLSIIVVDEHDAYVLEMTNDGFVLQEDDGSGILFRSNHYMTDELKHLNPDPIKFTSTYFRAKRVDELLKESYGKLRFQDFFRILSDHKDGINCLCRHPQGEVLGRTVSTSMFVLEDREAWTSLGNPCMNLRFAKL